MGRVHFGSFRDFAEAAYRGRDNAAKKALYKQLQEANLAGEAFHGFLDKVKLYAQGSAEAEGLAFKWKDSDSGNLLAGFYAGHGDAVRAAAFHFYFLSHSEYAARAVALNEEIGLSKRMDGKFETAVFGLGIPTDPDSTKRVYPIPPRPTANFDWPEYVSEKDANAPDADEGVWLNPLNHFSIPLSHRQKERELLDTFINDDRRFLICAMVAPSGAGKTRLVSQWMRKFVPKVSDTDWDAGFVTDRSPIKWENWDASRNTLIIIDYTYAYDEVMTMIAERCQYLNITKEGPKVRLLVIDHIYPDVLKNDFFWSRSFTDQGHIDSRKKSVLFEKSPIELRPEESGSAFLREIIAATASSSAQRYKPDDPKIVQGQIILSKMGQTANGGNPNAVRHPLFAALLGQTIRDGRSDPSHWTRRDLIKHYFDKPSRLPWCDDKEGQDRGIWIGVYVAAATLLRGVPFATLRKHLPDSFRKDRAYVSAADFIEQAASRLVSSSDRKILKPLEPDILGESFLIRFLKAIRRDERILSSFSNILLDCIAIGQEEESTLNLLETFQRLARNLLNDDHEIEEVKESWNLLEVFLIPEHFPRGTSLRQAMSMIRADTVKQCRAAGRSNWATQFAQTINAEDLRDASYGQLWFQAATSSMHYFEWQSRRNGIQDADVGLLVEINQNFRERLKPKPPILTLPVLEGCLGAAKLIRQKFVEMDVNASQPNSWTTLMTAAHLGKTDMVKWLIELGADANLSRIEGMCTPLILASQEGHTETVALLLEADATVNQGTRGDGWEAMFAAYQRRHGPLLKNGVAVEQAEVHYGWTPLMAACLGGHTGTVALLLEHEADVNQDTTDGRTALTVACLKGHTEIVALLLEHDAAVNQVTADNGFTALMFASGRGHANVVKCLLRDGAEAQLKTTSKGGWTALMLASHFGELEVVKEILKFGGISLFQKDDAGKGALDHARENGHEETAFALSEAMKIHQFSDLQ